ncbi:MAG: hypothetical protein QW090_04860 [Candidatus Bathyarchaeia archaeon]
METFHELIPEEREAVDSFAFSQFLLKRGGDVERRFSLISLDNSFEIALRAFLLKKSVKKEVIDSVKTVSDLLFRCEKAGLEVSEQEKLSLNEMHQKRNMIYHGKAIMLPMQRDLEAWSKVVGIFIEKITGVNPFQYFETKCYERISISPTDLEYLVDLDRSFRKKPPYVSKLTWWSEIQRDVVEAGEKWDLYIHYRPRWPFFIPTLVLVKCNPYNEPINMEYLLYLESKALFLKSEKKVWRVWLGIISSDGFAKEAIVRAEDHEGKNLGLILINPKLKQFHASLKGHSRKALKWLITW